MEQIIGIFGVPRSGTSWLGQIYNSSPDTRFSYQPMFTERFRDKVYPRSSAEAIEAFVKDMYLSEADFLSQDDYMVKAKKLQFHKESEKPDLQQRYPERVKFLHYEELSENPIDRTKEVFAFSGFELKEQTCKFIIDSQSRTEQEDPYSVYREKGDKGHIKTALPTEIVDSVKKDLEEFIPYCGWDFLEVYQ